MALRRLAIALLALAGLVGVAYVSQEPDSPGLHMVAAAQNFLDSLTPEQRAKATFAFDDKERTNFNFVPLQDKAGKPTRKGLRLEEMNDKQKAAARALLKAGTSESGFTKATTIMSLEAILLQLEKSRNPPGPVRNPEWYFVTLFGTPGKTDSWGWRVEGHHLSLNFTLHGTAVTAATPAFFGANPAEIKDGPRKGLRTLQEAEVLAQQLFAGLDAEQSKVARQPKQFPEIEQHVAKPGVGAAVGLPASKMGPAQRNLLQKLIEAYATRMPAAVAKVELGRVQEAGLDKVHFAFARADDKPGKPYTYRVQGPTFVIEFINEQADSAGNPANHIHSAWRNLQGDFGLAAR